MWVFLLWRADSVTAAARWGSGAFLRFAWVALRVVLASFLFFRTMGKHADNLGAADPLVSDPSFNSEADDAAFGLPSRRKVLLVLLLLALLVSLRRALSSPPIACWLGGSRALPRVTRSSCYRLVLPKLYQGVLIFAGVKDMPPLQTCNLSRMHGCKIFFLGGKFLLWTYGVLLKIVLLQLFTVF